MKANAFISEETTPKSLRQSVWSMARAKTNNKNWSFQAPDKRRKKNQPIEQDFIVVKMTKGRKYSFNGCEGVELDDLKEFARMKGKSFIKMGAIKIAA